mgnify:FL=1
MEKEKNQKGRKEFKIVGIIILILLVLFIIYVSRNMYIISNLSKNAEKTIENTNYHQIMYFYNLGEYHKEEVFALGNKKKMIKTEYTKDDVITTTTFANRIEEKDESSIKAYNVNIYNESKNGKKAILDKTIGYDDELKNEFYTENSWELFKKSMLAKIKTSTFNGEECYVVSNFEGNNIGDKRDMYIDKNTGLPISVMAYELKSIDQENKQVVTRLPIVEYVYEFNNVTEEEFIEPNINEYEIQK